MCEKNPGKPEAVRLGTRPDADTFAFETRVKRNNKAKLPGTQLRVQTAEPITRDSRWKRELRGSE